MTKAKATLCKRRLNIFSSSESGPRQRIHYLCLITLLKGMEFVVHTAEQSEPNVILQVQPSERIADLIAKLKLKPSFALSTSNDPLDHAALLHPRAIVSKALKHKQNLWVFEVEPLTSPSAAASRGQHALALAAAFELKKNFQKAREIYNSVVNTGDETNQVKATAYCKIGRILNQAKRFNDAHIVLAKAIELNNEDFDAHFECGVSLYHLEKYSQAIEIFDRAACIVFGDSNLGKVSKSKRPSTRKIGGRSDSSSKWMNWLSSIVEGENRMKMIDLFAWLSKALYKSPSNEHQNVAVKLVETILSMEENHTMSQLLSYHILTDKGQISRAVPNLLRSVVNPSAISAECKLALSKFALKPNGLKEIIEGMSVARENPASLAFMGSVLMEHGAMNPAIKSYSLALSYDPSHSAIALQFLHALEVQCRNQEIVDAVISLLEAMGDSARVQGLSVVHLLNILKRLPELSSYDSVFENLLDYPEASVQKFPFIEKTMDYKSMLEKHGAPPKINLSSNEIDLLGLLMTLYKVLFTSGALKVLPEFINFFVGICEDQDMHRTNIRTENTFYVMASSLLPTIKQPVNYALKPIYFIGDSHSLPASWHTIHYKGEERLIVPKLVTGVKCWHLRPSSTFFTKKTMESVMKNIPSGATVVFSVGEIDCRESINQVVEACKYDTHEEAVDRCVSIYLAAVERMIEGKNLEVYIHPVPPTFDLSRPIAQHFNMLLKAKLENNSTIRYLDFSSRLLGSKGEFNLLYALDGLHMHPAYLPLLEEALAAVS